MNPYRTAVLRLAAIAILATVPVTIRADTKTDVYRAMGLDVGDVLTGTVLNASVLPGGDKQVVSVVTYFTGKRERDNAVNVRLQVLRREGDKLFTVFGRDLGAERGGNVANGDLLLVDLDRDGLAEIVLSYEDTSSPVIVQRIGEVLLYDGSGDFQIGWSGPLEYDATKAARDVPAERRDRFKREIDIPNTLRSRGVTLFFNKTVVAVAGERLATPKVLQESFPLRPAPEDW